MKDKEGLEILGEWLSKEDTKFEKATDRFKKCVDPDLPEKLHTLLETLEFAKGVGFPFLSLVQADEQAVLPPRRCDISTTWPTSREIYFIEARISCSNPNIEWNPQSCRENTE